MYQISLVVKYLQSGLTVLREGKLFKHVLGLRADGSDRFRREAAEIPCSPGGN